MPPDPEDYDPVIWNHDKRPRRNGGVFQCERRGSFPVYRKSVYQLKDEAFRKLGWSEGKVAQLDAPARNAEGPETALPE